MFELTLLGRDLRPLKIIDTYTELVWTERFDRAGDVDVTMPVSKDLFDVLQNGNYLYIPESNKLMLIETIAIRGNSTDGHTINVTGRSLEAILNYRIIWNNTTLDGPLETSIQKLLNDNIIAPVNASRTISNFIYEQSGNAEIEAMTISAQYTGDNLYNVICQICEDYGIGFEVYLNDLDQFVFRLIKGADRTYNQYDRPVVEFSPNFDNLAESNFTLNSLEVRTCALVVGEENNNNRKSKEVIAVEASGLDRKELYIDANDIAQEEGVSDSKYLEFLTQRGAEELAGCQVQQDLDCSLNTNVGPKYGVDYFMGDIVQVQNEYGIQSQCRVVDLIRSVKPSGYYEYPTFELL